MGESRGIHHDADSRLARLMDPVDQLVFPVRLVKAHLQRELRGYPPTISLHIRKRLVAVDVGLTLAEQIEIWPVEDVDKATHGITPFSDEQGSRQGTAWCERAADCGRKRRAHLLR